MREILFRGKRIDNGEWAEGCCIYTSSGRHFIKIKKPITPHFFNDVLEVVPETVGQYTGLTDKNGNKIFEGDIVKFKEWGEGLWCWIGEVRYKRQGFVVLGNPNEECETPFEISLSALDSERIEVIGNIHDKPRKIKRGIKI